MPHATREGVSLFYETFGDPKTPALVFLHPLSTNRFVWAHHALAFAPTHHVVLVDHRGHGRSDRPATGYGVDSLSADLRAVLEHAGISRATLVGNSIGGMIALQTALDVPERVAALFVVSSATNLLPLVPKEVLVAYETRFGAAWSFMTQGATSARTKRERPEVAAFLEGAWCSSNFSPDVFLASMRDPNGVFGWNVEARLGELRVPTHVTAGDEDRTMPLASTKLLADQIPGATFSVVPEVGHYLELERPHELTEQLRALLARAS